MYTKSLDESREQAAEAIDKENRRNNIILYRVPESTKNTETDRQHDDCRFCFQVLNSLEVGAMEEDISKVIRLGRHDANNTRPVLLKLRSRAVKNLIMENLYKLKQARAEYRTVVVAHDMTRQKKSARADRGISSCKGPSGPNKDCQVAKEELVITDNNVCTTVHEDNVLKCLYVNARSLKNNLKIDELYLYAKQYKLDVIGISETWLNEDILTAEIQLQGYNIYNIYRKDRKDDKFKTGVGVILYVKDTLVSSDHKELNAT